MFAWLEGRMGAWQLMVSLVLGHYDVHILRRPSMPRTDCIQAARSPMPRRSNPTGMSRRECVRWEVAGQRSRGSSIRDGRKQEPVLGEVAPRTGFDCVFPASLQGRIMLVLGERLFT